jgi:tetratricopeptide (TPR) repeat protein
MTSSHIEKTAISMNNQGASLIDAGRTLEAISILSSALKYFQQQLFSEPEDTSVMLGHCSLDEMMSRNITRDTQEGSYTNSGFVHRRSIHVQQDTLCNARCSFVIAVAILFNLALAHHLTGVEKSRNPVLLQKAVKLYEHAHKLVRGTQGVGKDSVLFHLAVINNLGQLHKELKQDVLAEKCFHQLLSLLMYLLDSSREEQGTLLSSSYEEFLSNVYHLIIPGCSAVATAA